MARGGHLSIINDVESLILREIIRVNGYVKAISRIFLGHCRCFAVPLTTTSRARTIKIIWMECFIHTPVTEPGRPQFYWSASSTDDIIKPRDAKQICDF